MRRLLLTVGLLAVTLASAQVHLAVPSAPVSSQVENPRAMLLNYLHERFTDCEQVDLAPTAWTDAILARLSPRSVRIPAAGLLPLVQTELPVAGIVVVTDDAVYLHGAELHHWPLPDTPAGIRRVAGELGNRLQVDCAELAAVRYEDSALFAAHYGLPSYRLHWSHNTPAAKLLFLSPLRQAHPMDPFVAAEVLNAAAGVVTSRADADEVKRGMALAPLALPVVLGTPFEGTALAFARVAPEAAKPELEAIAKASVAGEISMDNLLGEDDEAEPVSAVQREGARRVLAAMSEPAEPEESASFIPGLIEGADRETLMRLANASYAPLAAAAREALRPQRPTDPEEAALFDLKTAHPYKRKQLLLRHREDPAFLSRALANADPGTRALALSLMSGPPAKTALAEAADDPYLWVRLQAAKKGEELLVPIATEDEPNPVVRLLGGSQEVERLPAARQVGDYPNLRWLCGMGAEAPTSPFDAYYQLNLRVDETWRAAYAAGKIIFARLSPISHPGLIITDPAARDRYWLNLIEELPPADLAFIDGVVYGEESMTMSADTLWPSGWRLFCLDAGIDPATVAGELERLNPAQREAWQYWAREKAVEGFNELYRFTKLYFGTLKPGFQVATFLQKEVLHKDGTYPPDRDMLFDVAGIYDYKGCNRLAGYWLVRRLKTLWPERPVFWLSLGIGGYEMNPVRYDFKAPQVPLSSRSIRAYADSVSAWLAGAQSGWFSTWMFVDSRYRGGRPESGSQVNLEDIAGPKLDAAIEYAFRGVLDIRRNEQAATEAPTLGEEATLELDVSLEEKDDPDAALKVRIEADKQALRYGMHLYRRYVYNCARVMGELGARPEVAPVLLVRDGISVWSRDGERPVVPGFGLFQSGDFVCEVNHLPGLDLSRYQVIGIHDPARLTDETIIALTQWLRTTAGILYIHGNLTADRAAGLPTPQNLEGVLKEDWPWEADLAIHPQEPEATEVAGGGRIIATIEGGEPLLSANGKTVLARWSREDVAGTVIVDGLSRTTDAYLDLLAPHLQPGGEPYFLQMGNVEEVTLATGSRYYSDARQPVPMAGVDLLTGEQDPVIGINSSAAIVAASFQGRHVAVIAGMAVLAEEPLTAVEVVPDGLRLNGGGLLRVRLATGSLEISTPLAERSLAELMAAPDVIGKATLETAEGARITYLRAAAPIEIRHRP